MTQDKAFKIGSDNILFFDMDGTLVETNYANYLSYKKAIKAVISTETDITYNPIERFNRGSLKKVFPNLSETEYEKIIKQKEEYYNEHLPQTKLNTAVASILLEFSKTNTAVLVTNCREDRALMTLNYYGLKDKFHNFFFRKFGDNKEKINKFENAISSLGVSPELVIAYEDEGSEIADAISAGILYINPIINIAK